MFNLWTFGLRTNEKRWVENNDGQNNTPEKLVKGKVPDGLCSDGHSV